MVSLRPVGPHRRLGESGETELDAGEGMVDVDQAASGQIELG